MDAGTGPDGAGAAAARDRMGAGVSGLVHVTTIPLTLWFLRGQAAFLRRQSLAVHAISSPGPELVRFGDAEAVPVHAVEMPRDIAPARDLAAVWRLWRVLRELRPSIVDAHTPKAGLLGMAAATLARTPVRVYHMHGLRFVTATGWKRRVLRLAERVSCALADRVLAVSPSLRSLAIAEGLCPPEKIRVILGGTVNGVDGTYAFRPQPEAVRMRTRAEHGIPPDALVVGFVGRLARDKGIVELGVAWRALRTDRRVHLLVVGAPDPVDPPPGDVLAALRADPRVLLLGHVSEMTPLYAAMDVVALPTYREGFGQVALEAAAMALPIVATRVPGCVDAVKDGTTGTLVPARDPASLVDALRRYLSDPELRARHGAQARQRALREFRQDAIWTALAAEYEDLLHRASRAASQGPS